VLCVVQAEETKQRRKEEKKIAREGLTVDGSQDADIEQELLAVGPSSKISPEEHAPLLLNPDLPNLKAVLDKADVILHVLDARDPVSYRLLHIEDLVFANEKSKLVFVLNKTGMFFWNCSGIYIYDYDTSRSCPPGNLDCLGEAITYSAIHLPVPIGVIVPAQDSVERPQGQRQGERDCRRLHRV